MTIRVVKPKEEEQMAIRTILMDLAEYYSTKLTDKQLDMYIEDLIEMGSENVKKAVFKYRRDWNSTKFPLPSVLLKQRWLIEYQG